MLLQALLTAIQPPASWSSYLKASCVSKDTIGSVWVQNAYPAWVLRPNCSPPATWVSSQWWASLSTSPVSTSGGRCSSWDQSKLSHLTCWLRMLQDGDLMSPFSNLLSPFRKQLFAARRLASWLRWLGLKSKASLVAVLCHRSTCTDLQNILSLRAIYNYSLESQSGIAFLFHKNSQWFDICFHSELEWKFNMPKLAMSLKFLVLLQRKCGFFSIMLQHLLR